MIKCLLFSLFLELKFECPASAWTFDLCISLDFGSVIWSIRFASRIPALKSRKFLDIQNSFSRPENRLIFQRVLRCPRDSGTFDFSGIFKSLFSKDYSNVLQILEHFNFPAISKSRYYKDGLNVPEILGHPGLTGFYKILQDLDIFKGSFKCPRDSGTFDFYRGFRIVILFKGLFKCPRDSGTFKSSRTSRFIFHRWALRCPLILISQVD